MWFCGGILLFWEREKDLPLTQSFIYSLPTISLSRTDYRDKTEEVLLLWLKLLCSYCVVIVYILLPYFVYIQPLKVMLCSFLASDSLKLLGCVLCVLLVAYCVTGYLWSSLSHNIVVYQWTLTLALLS